MRLADIIVYPLKSARGIHVERAEIAARGLAGDREWMVVDANGRCVTQRDLPALARLIVEPRGIAGGLRLSFDGDAIEVAFPAADSPRRPVTIWNDALALPEAPSAGDWLSHHFGRTLQLCHQPGDAHRPVADWGEPQDEVSLADAFPILVATTASLQAVKRATGGNFGMERFRPNLVIDGSDEWAEDGWAEIRVGAVTLDLVKPCARCVVTTVDQKHGMFAGGEPLDTLRRIRMSADRRVPGVLFGWNAVPRSFGIVRVGDTVALTRSRAPWPIMPERTAARA